VYSASALTPCRYLYHAIGHFDNVPQPEALLRVLLRREWLDSAFPTALQRLFQIRFTSRCQPFDIKGTMDQILQAAPAGFCQNPMSLLPAIQSTCQPVVGPADQVALKIEAAGILLDAYPGVWEPHYLSTDINSTSQPSPLQTAQTQQ
jgi:hypothetical protein